MYHVKCLKYYKGSYFPNNLKGEGNGTLKSQVEFGCLTIPQNVANFFQWIVCFLYNLSQNLDPVLLRMTMFYWLFNFPSYKMAQQSLFVSNSFFSFITQHSTKYLSLCEGFHSPTLERIQGPVIPPLFHHNTLSLTPSYDYIVGLWLISLSVFPIKLEFKEYVFYLCVHPKY